MRSPRERSGSASRRRGGAARLARGAVRRGARRTCAREGEARAGEQRPQAEPRAQAPPERALRAHPAHDLVDLPPELLDVLRRRVGGAEHLGIRPARERRDLRLARRRPRRTPASSSRVAPGTHRRAVVGGAVDELVPAAADPVGGALGLATAAATGRLQPADHEERRREQRAARPEHAARSRGSGPGCRPPASSSSSDSRSSGTVGGRSTGSCGGGGGCSTCGFGSARGFVVWSFGT